MKIVRNAFRYLSARQRWILAGKPERSDEHVQWIYEQECQPCEHFQQVREGVGKCKLCSCGLNLGHSLNKIRWATESCPIGKWKAEVELDQKTGQPIGPARREEIERSTEIISQMTPEERWVEHERRKHARRQARTRDGQENHEGRA